MHGEIRGRMHAEGLLFMLPKLRAEFATSFHNGSNDLSASENTYVDDDAFTIVVACASDLIPALRSLACLVASAFRAHGLCLNYNPNKTEAMVAFRGVGRSWRTIP